MFCPYISNIPYDFSNLSDFPIYLIFLSDFFLNYLKNRLNADTSVFP